MSWIVISCLCSILVSAPIIIICLRKVALLQAKLTASGESGSDEPFFAGRKKLDSVDEVLARNTPAPDVLIHVRHQRRRRLASRPDIQIKTPDVPQDQKPKT